MEVNFIVMLKKVTMKQQNHLVNVINFLGMAQDEKDRAKHFAACLQGQALVCEFNSDIQEQVLSQFARLHMKMPPAVTTTQNFDIKDK